MKKRPWNGPKDNPHAFPYGVDNPTLSQMGRGRLVYMTPARKAAARMSLNRIFFPEAIEDDGLSFATLMSLPGRALVGTIPDYKGQLREDELTVFMSLRGREQLVTVGSMAAGISDVPLSVRFNLELLSSLGGNGRVDFYYDVKSAATGVTKRSPVSSLSLLLHGAPETIHPPVVRSVGYGAVQQEDIVPELIIDIPATYPACKAGDRVSLRIGDAWFSPVSLGPGEVGVDTMVRMLVSADDIVAMAAGIGSERFTAEVAYEIDRYGIVSPSPALNVMFDLTPKGPAPRKRKG